METTTETKISRKKPMKKAATSLEVESARDEALDCRRPPRDPRWFVIARYLGLSSLAVGLSLASPGNLALWNKNTEFPSSKPSLNVTTLIHTLLVYTFLLVAFFALQGR
jgi:hypothetical protein